MAALVWSREYAEQRGWMFQAEGESWRAEKQLGGDTIVFTVAHNDTPWFFLLACVTAWEGEGVLEGYGGDKKITPKVVADATGETWKPGPAEPPAPPSRAEIADQVEKAKTPADAVKLMADWIRAGGS